MKSLLSQIHTVRNLALSGQAREALTMLESVGESDFATLFLVRGECFYALQQFNEARQEFKRALERAPNSPRAEILLQLSTEIVALGKSMRPPPAISQFAGDGSGSEIALFPPLDFSHHLPAAEKPGGTERAEIGLVSETLARIMERQGKFEDARKVYIQLSRLNPERYEYFHARMVELGERMKAQV